MSIRIRILIFACLLSDAALAQPARSAGFRLFAGFNFSDSYETNLLPEVSAEMPGLIIGISREWKAIGPISFESGVIHLGRAFAVYAGLVPDIVKASYIEIPASLRLQAKSVSLGFGMAALYGYGRLLQDRPINDGGRGTGYVTYEEAGMSRLELDWTADARIFGDFIYKDVFGAIRYRRNLQSPSLGDNSIIGVSYKPIFTDLSLLLGKAF